MFYSSEVCAPHILYLTMLTFYILFFSTQLRPETHQQNANVHTHLVSRLSRLHQFVRVIEEQGLVYGRPPQGATQVMLT